MLCTQKLAAWNKLRTPLLVLDIFGNNSEALLEKGNKLYEVVANSGSMVNISVDFKTKTKGYLK